MVKHVICFKLADYDNNKCVATKEVLMSMKDNVPTVLDIDVNIDQLKSQRSYDVMLEVTVEDWDALEEYQKDQYHCEVVKTYMKKAAESSVAIDYETTGK